MKLTEPYDPCPCGSGKKYKFCCYQNKPDTGNPFVCGSFSSGYSEDIYADLISEARELCSESYRLCQQGLKRMGSGDLEEAMPFFREATAVIPQIYTPANNLAVCLMALGRLDEAISVQTESLKASDLPNPFGLANMATFLFISGDEIGCRRNLEEALKLKMPSGDACVKVCEVLARLSLHQDIIDLVDACAFDDAQGIFFYSGVASANLGDLERAKHALRRVTFGFYKAAMVRRYLQHIKDGTPPHTIRGDWPYLFSHEVCPPTLFKSSRLNTDGDVWLKRRVTADFCETFLNESARDADKIITLLAQVTHPEAVKLLWLIAKGSFGPDSLRMCAAQELHKRGDLEPGQPIKLLLKGVRTDVMLDGICLNPDFRFGEELPKQLAKKYEKAVSACGEKRVDWNKQVQLFLDILKEAPAHYPARFNYAISLLHLRREEEALPVLRDLVEKQPDYLFAHGTLLQTLTHMELVDEADALVKSTLMPKETHPHAFATWMVAQAVYHAAAKRYDEAYNCIRAAHDCAPELSSVRKLWADYADYCESKKENANDDDHDVEYW